jgi:uncharacterized membrane protein
VGHRDLATAVCAWRGHVTPASDADPLDGPLLIGVDVDVDARDGTGTVPVRLARCLRCDAWCPSPRPDPATTSPLPAPAQMHVPRRGKALRSAVILRLIAVERVIHVVLYGTVALLAILLRTELSGVKSWVRHLLTQLTSTNNGTGNAFGGSLIVKEGNHLLTLKSSTLDIVIAAAVAYAVIEGTEAVGLWRERRWAEYLTVVATVGFVPYEVDELTKGTSVLKILALALNLVVLVYLLWSKELFGIGRLRHRRPEEPEDPLEPFYRPTAGDVAIDGFRSPSTEEAPAASP